MTRHTGIAIGTGAVAVADERSRQGCPPRPRHLRRAAPRRESCRRLPYRLSASDMCAHGREVRHVHD